MDDMCCVCCVYVCVVDDCVVWNVVMNCVWMYGVLCMKCVCDWMCVWFIVVCMCEWICYVCDDV